MLTLNGSSRQHRGVLRCALTDGEWPDLFAGAYRPHAFRDLWLGRMLNAAGQPGGGDGYAAATFQSVLTNVRWADDLSGSRALEELKQAASGTGMLSVRMTTLAYSDRDPRTSDFATGTVTGVIGPQLVAEPESYIAGRRFAPASGTTSWNGCSYCSGYVDRAGKRVFLDLSNALQLKFPGDASGQGTAGTVGSLNDIGTIRVGILRDPTVTEFTPATSANFLPIGQVDYRQNQWLLSTGGVVSLPLGDEHLGLSRTGHSRLLLRPT